MLKYISKRIIYLIPVLIGIVFLVFTIMYFSPGDPAKLILGDRAPEEQVAALRHELGLDLPYYQQLFNYIKNAIHGDFGNSYQLRMPVWDIIKLRFPLTLQLTTFTMLIAVLIGVPVGILSAVKQYSVIDALSVIFALLMASIPAFWLGMLLMLLFSLNLGWLPSSGYEGVKWLILPSITLGFINCATIMRMTRSSMLSGTSGLYPYRPRKGCHGKEGRLQACAEKRHHSRYYSGGYRIWLQLGRGGGYRDRFRPARHGYTNNYRYTTKRQSCCTGVRHRHCVGVQPSQLNCRYPIYLC